MGWILCVRREKSRRDFVPRALALIALVHPILHRVSCGYEKCAQTLCNAPKHEFRVQWSGLGAFVAKKSWRDFVAGTFASIAPVHTVLHRVSCSYEMIPNAPKHYERHQNLSLGSNGMDQVRLLGKITTWLRGTNICINCTSSVCFAPSFMQLRNDPKCTQILRNAPKH